LIRRILDPLGERSPQSNWDVQENAIDEPDKVSVPSVPKPNHPNSPNDTAKTSNYKEGYVFHLIQDPSLRIRPGRIVEIQLLDGSERAGEYDKSCQKNPSKEAGIIRVSQSSVRPSELQILTTRACCGISGPRLVPITYPCSGY
jgi:hypothetical protein